MLNVLNPYARLRRTNFACHDLFGIGSMVSSGISTAGTIAATKMTNETNKSIASDVNKTQSDIANANNRTAIQIHNDDMNFNAREAQIQRDWDSASSQRQRLVEAGYNPLMMGDFSSSGGSAASAPSSPSLDSPSLEVPQMQIPDLSSIGNLFTSYLRAKEIQSGINYNDEKAKGQDLDNKRKVLEIERLPQSWLNEDEVHSWQKAQHDKMMFNLTLLGRKYDSESLRNYADAYVKQQTAEQIRVQTAQFKENLSFSQKLHEKELLQLDEEISKIRAERASIYKGIEVSNSQKRLLDAQASSQENENRVFDSQNALDSKAKESEITFNMIRSCSQILNSDLTEQEKDAVAKFLATHSDVSASELFKCMKQVESAPRKDWSREMKASVWSFIKTILVGGAVGAAIYFSGGTASAAILGATGASSASGLLGKSPSAPTPASPSLGIPASQNWIP